MIPKFAEVLTGYRFVSKRWGRDGAVNERAVRAALVDAISLADGEDGAEPAALFYAFARRPRAFPGSWRLMPALLAVNQLRSIGYRLHAAPADLNSLLVAIAARKMVFDDVRKWFAEHTQPVSLE